MQSEPRSECPINAAVEVLGDPWAMLVLRDIMFGDRRHFRELMAGSEEGIATNILASRLDGFVDAGLMRRHRYADSTDAFEYLLTDKGRELAGVIIALTEWGDRWAAPDGPPILYTHTACDGPISHHIRCANCGEVHDASEVYVRPGPGMPPELAARVGTTSARQ